MFCTKIRMCFFSGIICLILGMSVSGCVQKEPELVDLGIPAAETYWKYFTNARNPWEMVIEDQKLYIGGGDYSINTGPTTIWCYDIEQKEWFESGVVPDEAVIRFVQLGDQLIAPGTDPEAGWELGNYYVLEAGDWKTVRTVPGGVHMYDIVAFEGGIFYAIGTSGDAVSPVQVSYDGDNTFEGISFIKDGKQLFGDGTYSRCRVYDFFTIGEDLYCFCEALVSDNVIAMPVNGIFRYEDGAFQYVKYFDSNSRSTKNRQGRIYEKVYFDNACFFTNGTLYKTDDFEELEILKLPDNENVADLLVEYNSASGEEELYLLGTKGIKGIHTNTIWKYVDDENYEEIYSFEYELGAMSFTKYGDDFFIGIGQNLGSDMNVASKYADSAIGKILQVHYK